MFSDLLVLWAYASEEYRVAGVVSHADLRAPDLIDEITSLAARSRERAVDLEADADTAGASVRSKVVDIGG